MPSKTTRRAVSAILICLALMLGATQPAWADGTSSNPFGAAQTPSHPSMSYGQLLSAIDRGQVKAAQFSEDTGQVSVTLRNGKKFDVTAPVGDTTLAPRLHKAGADISYTNGPGAGGKASWYLILIPLTIFPLVLAFGLMASRRQNRLGAQSRTQAESRKGRAGEATIPATRFSDVAGCDEAVEELQEMLDFLRYPERYERVKAKLPSGAILHGAPGTGKTLLARALDGEAGLPIYQASGSELVEMYVGVGAKRVRELFG